MLPFLFNEFTPLSIKASKTSYFPREMQWKDHLCMAITQSKIVHTQENCLPNKYHYLYSYWIPVEMRRTSDHDQPYLHRVGVMRVKGVTCAVCFNHFKSFSLESILVGWDLGIQQCFGFLTPETSNNVLSSMFISQNCWIFKNIWQKNGKFHTGDTK